jgi:hypothetical protein
MLSDGERGPSLPSADFAAEDAERGVETLSVAGSQIGTSSEL